MTKDVKFPNLESCDPRVCVSGKMMRCNRVVSAVFRKHLRPFGITNSQLSTLFIVSKAPKPTLKILSVKMLMDKSTVNRNLKRLLEQDLIRRPNIHDLTITNKGKTLLENVIPEWDRAMDEIRNILGEDGEMALNLVLKKLT